MIAFRHFLAALVFTGGSTLVFGQGALAPTGAPAPLGRTLDQLEPRVDVQRAINPLPSDFNSQIIINSPGSYYLSANLAVTKNYGIRIAASGVTLDLRGFTISKTSGNGFFGIIMDAGISRCTVQNGTVSGFSQGVAYSGSPAPRGGSFRKIIVSGCGAAFFGGDNWEFQSCKAFDNSGLGIFSGNVSILRDCVAENNGGTGIEVGAASVLQGCVATGNAGLYGIQAGACSTLSNCVSAGNTLSYGFIVSFGSVLQQCVARANTSTNAQSGGFFVNGESIITDCVATNNTNTGGMAPRAGAGITSVQNLIVSDCVVQGNNGDGIQVGDGSLLRDNNCDGNGNAGAGANIRATSDGSRIEGNHLTNGRRGIELEGTGNIVMRNTARANAINYVIVADNRYGPVVNLTAAGTLGVNGSGPNPSTLVSVDGSANYAQ